LLANARRPRVCFLRVRARGRGLSRVLTVLVRPALSSALLPRVTLLILLGRLIHCIQNSKIVLGVLKIAFGHHAIAAAGRITSELKILLKELLGGAADPDIRPIAVEDVVAVERNAAAMVAHATATTATTTRTVVAASHAFHVHSAAVALSRCDPASVS
jgi:hypothetical protein